MFRQADLSQFFLGNSGPLKRQNEQRTQYFRDYKKSKRSRQFLKEWKQNRPYAKLMQKLTPYMEVLNRTAVNLLNWR
jgi:hypothetical protein